MNSNYSVEFVRARPPARSGTVPAGTVPAAPTGLIATPSTGAVALVWNANAGGDNVTQYNIYRASGLGASFGSATLLTSVSAATLTYTNSGLAASSAWTYFIVAVNAVGSSAASAGASATVPAATVPAAPTGLIATPSAGAVALVWNANAGGDNVTQYNIYRASGLGASFGSATLLTSVSAATLTYTNSGLAASSAWTYFIVAVNAVGDSAASAGASATVPAATVPAAPTGLTTNTLSSGGAVRLHWNANAGGDNVTQYNIYRASGLGASFGSATLLTSVSAATLTYDDSGLTTGSAWTYFIVAVNAVGNSAASTGSSETVLPPAVETEFITTTPTLSSTDVGNEYIGMTFTVGSSNIRIISLGRWKIAGNSGTHLLKIVNPYPGSTNVANAFAVVDLSTGSAGGFVYADLEIPIVLPAGAKFYLVSAETNPGDTWYTTTGSFGHTGDATINGDVWGFDQISGLPPMFEGSSPNTMRGPVDFTYETTTDPVVDFVIGTLYPDQDVQGYPTKWARPASNQETPGSATFNFTGTVDLRLFWRGGSPDLNWSGTLQYYYDDGIPIGSPIHDSGIIGLPPKFVTTWDTTLVPDGTHVVWFKLIDSVGFFAYGLPCIGSVAVIHNGGFVNGAQDVWSVPGPQNEHRFGGVPDRVHYDGNSCPANDSHLPYPGPATVPPATADARYTGTNAALLRDEAKWIIEFTRASCAEWEGFPRWASLSVANQSAPVVGTGGGVFVWFEDVHRNGLHAGEATSRWAFNALGFDGTRFNNFVQGGWATFVEHPAHDGSWYGVEISGRFFHLTHDGTATTLAGPRQDRTKAPMYATIDGNLEGDDEHLEAVIDNAGEIVGTFDSGIAGPEWMLGLVDVVVDPRDTDIIYTCSEYLGCVFKIDTSASPAHVSLYAGTYDAFGYADGPATSALFSTVRSMVMTPDGTLYIADGLAIGTIDMGDAGNSNNLIRYVTPDGTTVGTLCGQLRQPTMAQANNSSLIETFSPRNSTPIPFASPSFYLGTPRCIRLDSTGHGLIVLENNNYHVRRIDLVAQTITFIGRAWDTAAPSDFSQGSQWMWLDVDRFGTCGPVDDIILNQPTTNPATWRMSMDGTYHQVWAGDSGIAGPVLVGIALGGGHYGWTIAISDHQGLMIMGGTVSDSAHQFRIAQATGADSTLLMVGNQLNLDVNYRAQYTFIFGTSQGWPVNIRPSFYSLMSRTGTPQIGQPTFDDLNADYPTSEDLAGFFQDGAGGLFPRPELTGRDMEDVEYLVRRQSFAGSYPLSVFPVLPSSFYRLWYPIVTSCSALVLSPTSIQVDWETDKPTIGMAVAGTEAQLALATITTGAYNSLSPIENLTPSTYATSHSAIIRNLSPNHTIHYNVLVKDDVGNFAYFNDQTIVPGVSPDGTFITTADLTSTLVSVHGLWSWGAHSAPTPSWGIGPMHRVLLNGQMVVPAFGFASWHKLVIDYGGNIYGLTFDQLWYQWCGGQWQPNGNFTGAADPPTSTPTPPTLPSAFVGPYACSANGTTISGGTGTVTTLEGVWSFGAASGGGWKLVRNGQPVFFNDSDSTGAFPITVTQMKVDSNRHLFYQRADNSLWYLWASQQQNPSNASAPGTAVPVEVVFAPPRGTLSASAATGTLVTKVWVVMSDGSNFTGSLAVSLDSFSLQMCVASGMNIVKSSVNIASEVGGGSAFAVTATQNSTSVSAQFNVQVGA